MQKDVKFHFDYQIDLKEILSLHQSIKIKIFDGRTAIQSESQSEMNNQLT